MGEKHTKKRQQESQCSQLRSGQWEELNEEEMEM